MPADIQIGDIYESCSFHPVRCTERDVNEFGDVSVSGVSLIDGSHPHSCSLLHCGVVKLTHEQIVTAILWGPKKYGEARMKANVKLYETAIANPMANIPGGLDMSKVTTADCVASIKMWPELSKHVRNGADIDWKRRRKFKNAKGQWTREFDGDGTTLFVTETENGFEIGTSAPGEIWYFQLGSDNQSWPGRTIVFASIVSKSFYDAEGYIDDQHIEDQLKGILPQGWSEEQESCFSAPDGYTEAQARQELVNAGFIEKALF